MDWLRNRPLAVTMTLAGAILLGVIAILRMPITMDPGLSYPGLTVEVEYPGVSPEKMEQVVSIPVEEMASTLGSIRELFSTSEDGKARVNVQFDPGTPVEFKAMELRERVDLVASRFPREAHKPTITRYDPDQRPIMMIQLNHPTLSEEKLREYAEKQLRKQLLGIAGVSEVFAAGGRIREVLIDCDRQKLQSFGLTLPDIFRGLSQANFNLAAGRMVDQGLEKPLISRGRFQSLDDVRSTCYRTRRSASAPGSAPPV
jgi:multidrug efflux pump subunit AcrB